MASNVNKFYEWGILGCGWLGQAVARSLAKESVSAWGSGRHLSTLRDIEQSGAVPITIDFAQGPPFSAEWPQARFLLVSLPPSAGVEAFESAARHAERWPELWTILVSSTSVYPATPGQYREPDAIRRVSPHSGACLLDLERLFPSKRTSIVRAGGLFGPNRHPRHFLRTPQLKDPHGAVNMVHQEDVVRAIRFLAQRRMAGAFNAVAPVLTTRLDFYRAAGATQAMPSPDLTPAACAPQGRRILSQSLMEAGFSFIHPDPALAAAGLPVQAPPN